MEFQFKLRLIRELEKKTYFLNESIDGFSAIDGTIDHSPLTQAPDRSDGYVLQNQSFNFLLLIDSSNVSPPPHHKLSLCPSGRSTQFGCLRAADLHCPVHAHSPGSTEVLARLLLHELGNI